MLKPDSAIPRHLSVCGGRSKVQPTEAANWGGMKGSIWRRRSKRVPARHAMERASLQWRSRCSRAAKSIPSNASPATARGRLRTLTEASKKGSAAARHRILRRPQLPWSWLEIGSSEGMMQKCRTGYMPRSKTAPFRSWWRRPKTRWPSWPNWASRSTPRWPPWTCRAQS